MPLPATGPAAGQRLSAPGAATTLQARSTDPPPRFLAPAPLHPPGPCGRPGVDGLGASRYLMSDTRGKRGKRLQGPAHGGRALPAGRALPPALPGRSRSYSPALSLPSRSSSLGQSIPSASSAARPSAIVRLERLPRGGRLQESKFRYTCLTSLNAGRIVTSVTYLRGELDAHLWEGAACLSISSVRRLLASG
jgi:hypothetical protein